jgi:hypothetical protein
MVDRVQLSEETFDDDCFDNDNDRHIQDAFNNDVRALIKWISDQRNVMNVVTPSQPEFLSPIAIRSPLMLDSDVSHVNISHSSHMDRYEIDFQGLSISELQLRKMSPIETEFKPLKFVTSDKVLAYLRAWRIYSDNGGVHTLYAGLDPLEEVNTVVAYKVGSTVDDISRMPSDELYALMLRCYSTGFGTPLDKFTLATKSICMKGPLPEDKAMILLKDLNVAMTKNGGFMEVSHKIKVRQFLACLPEEVKTALLGSYNYPTTVAEGFDSLFQLARAFQTGSLVVASLTVP